MKRFHKLSILIGALLLAFLIWEIGPGQLWRELTVLGWGLLPFILLEGVADLFRTHGWRYCLSGPHRSLSFLYLFRIRMAGISINYLTPTAGLGGDVTKGTLLSLNHPGAEAATGVIIGKLSEALAQLLFVVAGSLAVLQEIELPAGIWVAMLVGTVLLGGGIIGFLAVQKYGKLGAVMRWLVAHRIGGHRLRKAARRITEVDDQLKLFYGERPMNLPLSMFWHIVGMACGIVQAWYFLFLLTDHPSLLMAGAIWFLGSWFDLLSFFLPNIGFLEATRVVAFKALGFPSALGLTYGIALRLEQISWAGVGLLIYATLLLKKEETEPHLRNEVAENEAEARIEPAIGKGVDV
ncbi:MAG TPA: lysylphosphatidylglycerol synthase domain-containing protein [Thermodesulfobacteriota bacterium]|nr:lysylphosphatidylglycerol synthase domain-containing protein [Thermodesulfobacteriota bacterium]